MANTVINAKRTDMFRIEPERLTLVTDKDHPLYDPRVEEPLDEALIANIAMHGILEPVLVRKNGELIEVVAGRQRVKAALEVNRRFAADGKTPIFVPVIVKGGADKDLFGILIAENELRREDSMILKGEKARKLHNLGYSIPEIAVTFGVSRQAVDNWLNVQQLPEPIKEAVQSGDMSGTAALELAKLPREEQAGRFEAMKEQGLKPTIGNTRSAAATPKAEPIAKMKTRREVEAELGDRNPPMDDWNKGYCAALKWALGRA